jgi:hypothetical protein
MATGIKDRIVLIGADVGELDRMGQDRLSCGVFLKTRHRLSLVARLVALGIDRRLATLRRCQRDLHAGILEHIVGGGELFEPEAGRLACIPKLVVRSQNHQDLHCQSPLIEAHARLGKKGFAADTSTSILQQPIPNLRVAGSNPAGAGRP